MIYLLEILTKNYPQLKYNNDKQEILGNIHIEYICNDEFIKGDFEIKIKLTVLRVLHCTINVQQLDNLGDDISIHLGAQV